MTSWHLTLLNEKPVIFSAVTFASEATRFRHLSRCSDLHRLHVFYFKNGSPYSVLDGNTIQIKPYNASFTVPTEWVEPREEPNLYLSWDELNRVNAIDISNDFDGENAQLINGVLDFENCAAHFGDKNWGNYLWNDLQGRVYVSDSNTDEIVSRIETNGLKIAREIFEKGEVFQDKYKDWKKVDFKILDAPTHFLLNKRISFYIRPNDNRTVIFVFVHAWGFQQTIDNLLDSFVWVQNN